MTFILRISGPDSSWVFSIPQGTTSIGREKSREIVLAHPLVSRLHAQLTCSEQECQITDLGSANGTQVGEKAITPQVPCTLQAGDLICIGPFEMVFDQEFDRSPEETHLEANASDQPGIEAEAVEQGQALTSGELGSGEPGSPEPSSKVPKAGEAVAEPLGIAQAELEVEIPPIAGRQPPPLPPPPASLGNLAEGPTDGLEPPIPPGLSLYSRQLLRYLPGIYNTDFMSRFLALFESILIPVQWNVDNFDLFLDPGTSPIGFLPWLARWFEVIFDDSWSEVQRRAFLKDAHLIYARHGTRWALRRVLEIYTGFAPEIVDVGQNLEPHTFVIHFPFSETTMRTDLLSRIIDEHKPAHSTYSMKFSSRG